MIKPNKKTAILLISIFSVIIICGAVFAFQKNGQVKQDDKSLLDEFGKSGLRSAQNNKDDKQEDLINYSAQAVITDGKEQKFNLTQTLELFAKTGKDLLRCSRKTVWLFFIQMISILEMETSFFLSVNKVTFFTLRELTRKKAF